jgi:enoyl-[acyl-carrier-protein] reductase (NADH)
VSIVITQPVLKDKKALVVGIANEHSIAYGCAKAFHELGDLLLNEAVERAPIGELVDIMDVGFHCAFLATPYGRRVTGGVVYVDGGANIMA